MQYQRLPRLLSFCFFLAVLQLSAVHARAADFSAMEGLTPREALELANEWRYTRSDMDKMYVDSREIVLVAKDGDELRLPLPEDEMVIAIAPYEQQTHTWSVHFISSCQGELPETTFQAKATASDGEVLYNGPITSLKNGFFEIWLPRGRTVVLTVKHNGKAATQTLSTKDKSPTCITTMQLQ